MTIFKAKHSTIPPVATAGMTFMACMMVTIPLWWNAKSGALQDADTRFTFRTNEIQSAITQRMGAYAQVLRGGLGLFAASEWVDRNEWRAYVEALRIGENYPGIQGIGFSERIPADQKDAHIRAVQAEGFPNYGINPPGERAEYTSIVYLEPFDWRNQRAFGYDMFSEPVRNCAMVRARDTGETALSGKVRLVQETDEDVQPGLLMFVPVYRKGLPLDTVEQRRAAIFGYVYSPFRAENLMRGVLGKDQSDIALEIFDGTQTSRSSILYESDPSQSTLDLRPLFVRTKCIVINGHPWTLQFTSLPSFEATIDMQQPRATLITGAIISLLISTVSWSLAVARRLNAGLEDRVIDRTVELNIEVGERTRAEEKLRQLNEELERRVMERTGELEETHRQLLDASRQAGMAEVATSVLHNVGNVLNSVNVSCEVMSDRVRKSRVEAVAKTAEVLKKHANDLSEFLTADPAGRKLPGFMEKLAARLLEERSVMIDELRLLGRNIGHIKEVIAVQQNYAHAGGVCETLPIQDLVEDALRMNAQALLRHQVKIVRNYQSTPPFSLEKHKVLQILINLIRNAKFAVSSSDQTDKRISVGIAARNEYVAVSVSDNGVGIAPQNLTRIFAFGFTTKSDGHGFGLHGAVLAAKQMGGRLTAHSDGLGRGATFVLELPLEPRPSPVASTCRPVAYGHGGDGNESSLEIASG